MSLDPHLVRQDHPRSGQDEPIRTLLWTAAAIRPLDEVAALVGLLKRTGVVPSPGDEALRAAAVARPLDEVRQLVVMLNEPPRQVADADPVRATRRLRAVRRGAAVAAAPVVRSVLRWPTALALLVVGLIHLPKDLTELRSGGYSDALSVVVTALCLTVALWLMVWDMVATWAASAVTGVAVLIVHSLVGAGRLPLPESSFGASSAWARAAAPACAVVAAALAGTVLARRRWEGAAGVRP